jgi:hypothetical protein
MKINILLVLLLAGIFSLDAYSQTATPDFAYPQKVSQEAENELKTASGAGELRALVNYVTAQNLISNDNLGKSLQKIAKVADNEKDACNKAMLKVLLADVYSAYYQRNMWKFNQRQMSVEDFPEDVAEWSGEHFKAKIKSLYTEALRNADALKTRSLVDYKDALTGDNTTWIYYPTVFDFIATKAIDVFYGYEDKMMTAQLFDALENMHKTYSKAALINTQLKRLDYEGINGWEDGRQQEVSKSIYELNYSQTEYCCDALLAYSKYSTQTADEKLWLYNQLQLCIDKYPAYWQRNALINRQKSIERVTVDGSTPTIVAPGHAFKIAVTNNNATEFSYRIYAVNKSNKRGRRRFSDYTSAEIVKSGTVTCDKKVPFTQKTEVTETVDKEGSYCLVVLLPGEKVNPSKYYYEFLSTSIYGVIGENRDVTFALAVNPATGEPIQGASVTFTPNKTDNEKINVGLTDKMGYKFIEPTQRLSGNYGIYDFTKGQSTYSLSSSYPLISKNQEVKEYRAQGFTSLGLYHPGDSVDWAFVVVLDKNKERKVAANEKLTVTMRDANGQEVASGDFTSDEFGRIFGKFAIPETGLTGRFRLSLTRNKGYISSVTFTVSDYKLPTYDVGITAVKKNYPSVGDVTIVGKAMTFSGFPIANADVAVNLLKSRRMGFRYYEDKSINTQQVNTDENGEFSVTFTSDKLGTGTCFKAIAEVTSQSGENQRVEKYFVTGKPYSVDIQELGSVIDVTSPTTFNVAVYDEKNEKIALLLKYQLVKDGKTIKEGAIQSGKTEVDWLAIPAGTYKFEVQTADTTLADKKSVEIIIYRPTDEQIAVEKTLWAPKQNYKISGNKVKVLCGTSEDNVYLYSFVSADSAIISKKCEKINHGYHYVDVEVPHNQAIVTLYVVKDLKVHSQSIVINRETQSDDIQIVAESFRDKILPGETETWKFTIKNDRGAGVRSAVAIDMYNKALSEIQPFEWSILSSPYYYSGASAFNLWGDLGSRQNFSLSKTYKSLTENSLTEPAFNDYGENYGLNAISSKSLRMRGRVNLMANSDEQTVATDMGEMKLFSAAATAEKSEAVEAVADVEVAGNEIAEESAENEQIDDTEAEVYHDSEVALGLYRPDLKTNADGDIEISFTVPSANTTWVMQAVAWTEDAKMAKLMKEVVASKPIMVSTNAPRFVRVGDKIQIVSTVMNNSDQTRDIQSVVEIFNPVDGKVIATEKQANTLNANVSAIVTIDVEVPSAIPLLGVRVKAGDESYRDGEQTVIPVHEALSPVIETTTFYMPTNQASLDVQLPQVPENARVTLEFCENPQWAIVTALPGLRKSVGQDANSAAAAIYSAGIARAIIKENPMIVTAIKQWESSNKSDSMLVSMLQKNENLKIALLNATPWMQDAQNDTERMARISLLFDDKELNNSQKQAIELLQQLQVTGGGWSWIPDARNNRASYWSTLNVLTMMGELKKAGALPDDKQLVEMINNAIQYLDNETYRQYQDAKKSGEYSQYVYVRDLFADNTMSLNAKQVQASTIQYILKNWKSKSIATKSMWALLLYNHQYKAVAKTILQSLREFSQYTPQKGRWFPSLYDTPLWSYSPVASTAMAIDAFSTIEPGCEEVEQMRQWIILQKVAENWGTTVSATKVISTLFSQTKMQLGEASQFQIKIGEVDIQPDKIEQMTGYFKKDISNQVLSGNVLNVSHQGANPSYGAIYYQYSASPENVSSSSCDGISVEKIMLVQRNTQDGVTWEKSNTYNVGDNVKTQYTIKTTRNLQYVTLIDERASALEPVDQLPGWIYSDGAEFYRENRNETTDLFISYLPKGVYVLTVESTANNAGEFTSGIVTAQSQYAPQLTAHSAGGKITVKK